jgi:hypothetical protein
MPIAQDSHYTYGVMAHSQGQIMSERSVLLQRITNQRGERPDGLRIWSDGMVQRVSEDNPPPDATERLDVDRELKWQDERHLDPEQVDAIRAAIQDSGFFDLPPRLLINYCKDDPGAAIWTVNLNGRTAHVVLYDPRPRRSPVLDRLSANLDTLLTR